MSRVVCGLSLFVSFILMSSECLPQSEEEGVHTHDGFFMRLGAGPASGFSRTTIYDPTKIDNLEITVSGTGADLDLAIGGAIRRNFVIHADFWGIVFPAPLLELSTAMQTDRFQPGEISSYLLCGGAGVTYFAMPMNVYFSISWGISSLQIEPEEYEHGTEIGFSTIIRIGREWWISSNWGLGVAVNFIYAAVPAEEGALWNNAGGGLLLSATYN